jgi:hypothetical protein
MNTLEKVRIELENVVNFRADPQSGVNRALALITESAAPPAPQEPPEFETRDDGKVVRRDRWELGIRRIVALLWGNRHEFEVDDVVEAVRKLVPEPFNAGDDEGFFTSVVCDRAVSAAPQEQEQAGWRMVPVEPTDAMVDVAVRRMFAEKRYSAAWEDVFICCYRAMLEAAPPHPQPAAPQEPQLLLSAALDGVPVDFLQGAPLPPTPEHQEPEPEPEPQPVAWMFQHDETGLMCFCPNDGVNTVASFVAGNPRYAYVAALYPLASFAAPPAHPSAEPGKDAPTKDAA